MKPTRLLTLLASGVFAAGCASTQEAPPELFNGAWKQNECVKIADNRERDACLESAAGLPPSS